MKKAKLLLLMLIFGGFAVFGAAEFKGAPPYNLVPRISPAPGQRDASIIANCQLDEQKAVLSTPAYNAEFSVAPQVTLTKLYCAEVKRNVLVYPRQTKLFRLKLASGRIIDGTEMSVKKLLPVDKGFTALLYDSASDLECAFTAQADDDELRLGLTVKNCGSQEIGFMVAFPHLDGLALSENNSDDHYFFPWSDGVLNDQDIRIRSIYGGNDSGKWQMMDLFSPTCGGGIYVRCDDSEGINKGICFRRGQHYGPSFHWGVPDENDAPGRIDRSMNFYDNLEVQNGAAFSFDYQMYKRSPCGEVRLPEACLGTHSGNWKNAMRRYVQWSNATWPPRQEPARNANRWNRVAGYDSTRSLQEQFGLWEKRVSGEIPPDPRAADIYEFVGWWTQSNIGPWGVPLDQVSKENMGEMGTGLVKAFTSRDPLENKLWFNYNLGDYNGYNPQWGGLEAFRKLVKNIRSLDKNVTLYFDPVQCSDTSEYGAKYGAKYVCINPAWGNYFQCPSEPKTPAGAIFEHCMYCMCLNDADYVNDFVFKVQQACRETGVDGVRLDVCGSVGFICLSKEHNHVFKEEGQNVWAQAQYRAVKLVRQAMDEVDKSLTLEAEYAQNDHFASLLDGACSYETGTCLVPFRPVPINLFRFYFPHCRSYQINQLGQKEFFDYCLFNADGTLDNYGYSHEYTKILTDNVDAFTGDIEPLVDTLTEHLYANEFKSRSADKIVWTLLNYSGKALKEAPALAVDDSGRYRYLELISQKELLPVNGILTVSMEDRQVICVVRRPK